MSKLGSWRMFAATMGTVLLTATTLQAANSKSHAKVDTGKLEGKSDGTINAFLGIPYATPPVGDLRWRPPARLANGKARARRRILARAACRAVYMRT